MVAKQAVRVAITPPKNEFGVFVTPKGSKRMCKKKEKSLYGLIQLQMYEPESHRYHQKQADMQFLRLENV